MLILISVIYLLASILLVVDHTVPVIPAEFQGLLEPALAALGAALLFAAVRNSIRQGKCAPDVRTENSRGAGGEASSASGELQRIREEINALRAALEKSETPLSAAAAPTGESRNDVSPAGPPAAKPSESGFESAITLLSMLQQKGRLVDFVMAPLDGVSDEQIAAVARVVHDGCRELLGEWVKVAPIYSGNEGDGTVLEKGFSPEQYRLVGRAASEPPFHGTVIHRGWKIEKISLPRSNDAAGPSGEPVITPAEVEIQ